MLLSTRKSRIVLAVAIALVIGVITLIVLAQNEASQHIDLEHIYSDVLSAEEVALLEDQPVTWEILERVVGTISDKKDIGSGRYIYTATCERFGDIVLSLEMNKDINEPEVMRCVVSTEEENYVLFGKYAHKAMNELS